jgi:type IX secretion system PorP/SprF family membrane protein
MLIYCKERLTYALLFFIFIQLQNLSSQEQSIYNNDYLDPFTTNPACTGSEYYPVAHLSIKKQWLGFTGSPTTEMLSGNFRIGKFDFYDPKGLVNKGPFKLKDRIGLGAAIYQDDNGPIRNSGGCLAYAYHLPINRFSRISVGMSIILTNYSFNKTVLKPDQYDDVLLFDDRHYNFNSNLGGGAYYYNENCFIGFSLIKIIKENSSKIEPPDDNTSYFAMGGYKFNKNDIYFNFEPSFNLKKIGNKATFVDFHAKLYIKSLNWFAISYSTYNQISAQFAMQIYRMTYIGYCYGYTISKIASYNYGIHEISIGINLGLVGIEGIKY